MQNSVIDQQELLSTVGEKPLPEKYFTPPYLDAEPTVSFFFKYLFDFLLFTFF